MIEMGLKLAILPAVSRNRRTPIVTQVYGEVSLLSLGVGGKLALLHLPPPFPLFCMSLGFKDMTKEYQEYLESPAWREFRKKAFEHYGRRCNKCQTTKNLQVHHLHYDNIFNEKLEDVRILCKAHHEETHGIKKVEKKPKLTPQQLKSKADKKALRKEKRSKKKLGKLVQDRKYRQHLQAQKSKNKQVHAPKPKNKRINPRLPSPEAILQKKYERIARQMRVVE